MFRFAYRGVALLAGTSQASAQDAALAPTTTTESEESTVQTSTDTSHTPVDLMGKLDGLTEQVTTLESDVKKLKAVGISGYLQARYELQQGAHAGVDPATGKTGSLNTFYVRRGRIKFTLSPSEWSSMVIQPNFSKDGVNVCDAYVDIKDPWFQARTLRDGQFKVPYGYEIEQSSSLREVPEHSAWEKANFDGERDRGGALYGKFAQLRYALAIVNGNGTKDRLFPGTDNNFAKDVAGRIGTDLGWLIAGVSGYNGKVLLPGNAEAVQFTTDRTQRDKDGDGTIEANEPSTIAVPARPNLQYNRRMASIYYQLFQDIPYVGGFSVKCEYNRGWSASQVDRTGKKLAFGQCRPTKSAGWHVLLSQFIGPNNQLVYRIDRYIPDFDANATANPTTAPLTSHVFAWNLFWRNNVRLTTAYELPHVVNGKNKNDGLFTEQLQFTF